MQENPINQHRCKYPKVNISWNSNTLATWCEELTHLKSPWCWERLKVGGDGDDRGWDGWMASPTGWIWVWVNSRSWWRTGKPGMLQSMRSQSQTQLSDWTEQNTGAQTHSRTHAHTCIRVHMLRVRCELVSTGFHGFVCSRLPLCLEAELFLQWLSIPPPPESSPNQWKQPVAGKL